ncbi:MAG: pitrilysin family protein [Gammaproteobacteria bacterium]|nr:pitrilysin family protein [Gammaproteobacteria bacterium]
MMINSIKQVKILYRGKQMVAVLCLLLLSSVAHATPEIQTWQTENGAKILFVPATGIPMLDVRITFDAGSARDAGKSGLAVLTNGLLAEGAAGRSAQQIAEDFESVGAQIDNEALRDMALVGVRSLTESRYLTPALENLKLVLTQPDFPQTAFQRVLNQMKLAVKARQQSPAAIAGEAFNKAVYGDHPYASPVAGTKESLQQITPEDVRDFYQQYYVASNATVAIVGNVDRSQAEKIANQLTASLPTGVKPAAIPPVRQLTEAKKIVIEYPSAQTHIFVGQPGTRRSDADYFTLYVANHPFGGSGFASRLVEVIREDHGLAYSVSSYFSPQRELGIFAMGMQTKSDQTEQALSLLNEELNKYVESGPTQEELTASLSNITGGFPLKMDGNGKLLEYIAMIGFYDLPTDYLDHFIDNVRAVDLKMINDALKRRLQPDKMVTVVVGKQQQNEK